MIRRLRAIVMAGGLGATVLVGVVAAGHAASANPADQLLDRARAAVEDHDFSGVVRVTWWDATGRHHRDVPVRAVDGALKVSNGAVIGDDGRAWMRTGGTWSTLWSGVHEPQAPSLDAKYSAAAVAGPTLVGRPTRMLVVRREGQIAETVVVDRETGLMLRRVLYDAGRPALRTEFRELTELAPRTGSFRSPAVGGDAPTAASRSGAPRRLAEGYALVGAHHVANDLQLQYTDGVFSASVFRRDAELDRSRLPAGGRDTHIGTAHVRAYRTPEGSVLVWESAGRTWTCVTDAPRADRAAIVAALSRSDDDAWSRVSRFLTAPFRWV
jgi:hypothetical protein